MTKITPARISFAGDNHIFIELDEEMSLHANFRAAAIANAVSERDLDGIIDVSPSNTSLLVTVDPLIAHPRVLADTLHEIADEASQTTGEDIEATIVELPVLFDDPWTRDSAMRFRTHHQTTGGTDIQYCAELNGFDSIDGFIDAYTGAPWFTTMVGFFGGCPFLFQLVPRERQLTAPFYLRPRTDTPKQTVALGGAFTGIYGVRAPGGYQMLGVTPAPIYDPTHSTPGFTNGMVLFRPGLITKFTAIDRTTYDALSAEAEDGIFQHNQATVRFSLSRFLDDPDEYNEHLIGALHGS